jgi:hypothetical protein
MNSLEKFFKRIIHSHLCRYSHRVQEELMADEEVEEEDEEAQ